MGERKFAVGDRVSFAGGVGTVTEMQPGYWQGYASVKWDAGGTSLYKLAELTLLEPAPTPKPAELCQSCGKPFKSEAVVNGVRFLGCPCVPNDGSMHAYALSKAEPPYDWVPTGPPPMPPVPERLRGIRLTSSMLNAEAERDALKAELATHKRLLNDAQHGCAQRLADRVATDGTSADLRGLNDRLKRDNAELTTQVTWLTRELVVAKAKSRGGR